MKPEVHRLAACIDRSALAHNLAVARKLSGNRRVLAVIKANAYGHGLLPVAQALQQADMFGVTDIHEAERLRQGGTDREILILQGSISADDIRRAALQGFQLVIHRVEDLLALEQTLDSLTLPQPLTFWLKLDSGMGRLGLAPQDFATAYSKLQAKPWTRSIVMMTHLANASLPDSALNATQLACFDATRTALGKQPAASSVVASAGILALDTKADWARPGIMLYGSSPFAWADTARRRDAFGLRNVMTLQARLLSVHEHQAGDNIGYNSQFICPTAMRIGTISCGYADGYPSNTPNGSPVLVCGKRTTTVGRVSMDMLAVDLSHIPAAQTGTLVTLWGTDAEGNTLCIDEVAAHTGILSYNLTCSITARVPLVYS